MRRVRVLSDLDLLSTTQNRYSSFCQLYALRSYPNGEAVYNWHCDGGFNDEGRLILSYTQATQGVYNEDIASMDDTSNIILKNEARPFQFKPGDIWRQALLDTPGIKPFVHKAPVEEGARLLIVA